MSLYVAESRNEEGVFSDRVIAAGDEVMEIRGPSLRGADIEAGSPLDHRCIQVGPDRFVDPGDGFGSSLNHSCDPNARLVHGPRLRLEALRSIPAGEEICFDYEAGEPWSREKKAPCNCGSARCRGRVSLVT